MKLKKIVCPFLCLLLLCGCSHITFKKKNNPHQEVGESVQELGYKEHSVYSILYPKTEIEELDTKVASIVHDRQKEFDERTKEYKEKRKAEYNVTYESYVKDDRYISILLYLYESIYQNKEDIVTLIYDSKEKHFVSLDDVMHGEYLNMISEKAQSYFKERFPQECDQADFKAHTSAALENFSQFVLKKDRIVFYFPSGRLFDQSASMEIMYSDVSDYMDMEPEATSAFVPYDQVLNENVKPIDKDKPMVALTFDDGPSKKYTASILDALKEYNASATFFVLGSNAENAPDLLQRMVLEGNEIGNHTFSHKQLTTLSKEGIEEEIKETKECIYQITHTYPQVLRPPYGSKNDLVLQCANDAKVVTWTLDTRDWKDRDAKIVVERILKEVKDGDIILMHDLYASSAQAARIVIPKLQDAGYQLVTVSQLYETKGR
ncbi:polysaccharide deacetylase family protein [[Eubacterium] hominis]|uniref:polysaccharide deacetylase family protein n=1 Tax=[Eubacterium] hominis TaxID=2764325 RepID=UPI003A4D77F3